MSRKIARNASSRHNTGAPQHRGVESGGRLPRGKAKSPKRGGLRIENDAEREARLDAQAGLIRLLLPCLPSAA